MKQISEIINCLDWKSRSSFAYLTSIVILNVRDFLEDPLRLPTFVRTADDPNIGALARFRVKIFRCAMDWFLPGKTLKSDKLQRSSSHIFYCLNSSLGSAVIFEDYRSFVLNGRFNNPPTLMCYHPHGIISLGIFHLSSLPEMKGYRIMGAPVLKYFCPLFRLVI